MHPLFLLCIVVSGGDLGSLAGGIFPKNEAYLETVEPTNFPWTKDDKGQPVLEGARLLEAEERQLLQRQGRIVGPPGSGSAPGAASPRPIGTPPATNFAEIVAKLVAGTAPLPEADILWVKTNLPAELLASAAALQSSLPCEAVAGASASVEKARAKRNAGRTSLTRNGGGRGVVERSSTPAPDGVSVQQTHHPALRTSSSSKQAAKRGGHMIGAGMHNCLENKQNALRDVFRRGGEEYLAWFDEVGSDAISRMMMHLLLMSAASHLSFDPRSSAGLLAVSLWESLGLSRPGRRLSENSSGSQSGEHGDQLRRALTLHVPAAAVVARLFHYDGRKRNPVALNADHDSTRNQPTPVSAERNVDLLNDVCVGKLLELGEKDRSENMYGLKEVFLPFSGTVILHNVVRDLCNKWVLLVWVARMMEKLEASWSLGGTLDRGRGSSPGESVAGERGRSPADHEESGTDWERSCSAWERRRALIGKGAGCSGAVGMAARSPRDPCPTPRPRIFSAGAETPLTAAKLSNKYEELMREQAEVRESLRRAGAVGSTEWYVLVWRALGGIGALDLGARAMLAQLIFGVMPMPLAEGGES